MERVTRSDVYQRTIEEQNQKIEKYQAKLRDVVTAYKDLQKEKNALEESFKALSLAQSFGSGSEASVKKQITSAIEEITCSESETSEVKNDAVEGVEKGDGDESEEARSSTNTSSSDLNSLRSQLSTLAASLSTVSEQKSRIEASYMAEKKKMKHEMEDVEKRFAKERDDLLQRVHQLEGDTEQWRIKVRNQQVEREKELSDHAIVIKELQKVIGDERLAKEQLENQLEDSRMLFSDKQHIHQNQVEFYENTIRDLRRDLENASSQMKALKEKSTEPSSMILHLQKELIDVKESERRLTLSVQQLVDDRDSSLRQMTAQHEAHVAVLEARLTELSDSVGSVERLRQQDQITIQKLRERLVQLDKENSALTSAAQAFVPYSADASSLTTNTNSEANQDASVLVDKILHLKDRLKNLNENSDKPIVTYDMLLTEEERIELHRQCAKQLDQVREEFERYKLRAQSILKNKSSASTKDNSSERETSALRSQVAELRDRVTTLRLSLDEQDTKIREKEDGFTRAMAAVREAHRAELAERETVHRARIAQLELDMRRHRDRTVSMLAERDRELATARLQACSDQLSPSATAIRGSPALVVVESDSSGVGASSLETNQTDTIVSELISNVEIGDDSKILHFANERSRYEAELTVLRRQKHSIESALRDARRNAALVNELHADEMKRLAEEIAKRDRNNCRENANLEYLKNVVFRYMVCRGGASTRQQMLNAISTILQFSPSEKQQVQDHIASGSWWPTAKPTT